MLQVLLSKQYNRENPFIGALNLASKKMDLYDANLGKFPFYSYRLQTDHPCLFVHMTDESLFAVSSCMYRKISIHHRPYNL